MIKLGLYKHSKSGNVVRVLFIAKHSETLEDFVVYDHLGTNDLSSYWIRPISMWEEEVDINGQSVKRFEYIGE
jgi:hypothetical protein